MARETAPLERALASTGGRLAEAVTQGVARWGVRVAIVSALAAAVAQFVDFGVYGLRIRQLDMSTHASVFGVLSVLALVTAGGAAVLLAVAETTRRGALLVLPPLLAALLALRVLQPTHVLLWALPFAAATFVVLWWCCGTPASATRRLIRAGCAILIGSYAIHALGTSVVSALGYGPASWPYQIKLVVKHSGELAGWTIIATGLATIYPGSRRLSRSSSARSSEPQ